MARVRSRNTEPELLLRRALWKAGLRYRVGLKVPGTPDIALVRHRLAIFVDGCFWHGCPQHYTAPVRNAPFWRAKLERNLNRDVRVTRELEAAGWHVLRLWMHEIVDDLPSAAAKVLSFAGAVPLDKES